MTLAERGERLSIPNDGSILYQVLADLWHPSHNSQGFVSLGVAENSLCHDALISHVHKHISLVHNDLTYGTGTNGSPRLKAAMARFLNKHFAPAEPVDKNNVTITNGCSAAVEHLSWCLANPGDGFLLGQPYYGTFIRDVTLRTGTPVLPVAFRRVDPLGLESVQIYEQALLESKSRGQRVAGLILCNPHNPLGRCYDRQVIISLMELCEKYKIHLISDEIYALSVWQNTMDDQSPAPKPFTSCLNIPLEGIMDPSRLHIVWGMSKDFGANGIRLGALITRNAHLQTALVTLSLYSSPSSISEHVTANILEDNSWTEAYLARNREMLAEHHCIAVQWAKLHEVPYAPGANAGFFLWVDLGTVYRRHRPGARLELESIDDMLMSSLMRHKVFLASGKLFGAEKPGWFRIVFSVDKAVLMEGLRRIETVLFSE